MKKAKTYLYYFISIFLFTPIAVNAQYTFTNFNQPANYQVGVPFQIVASGSYDVNDNPNNFDCVTSFSAGFRLFFAVNLPTGWTISSSILDFGGTPINIPQDAKQLGFSQLLLLPFKGHKHTWKNNSNKV